METKSPKFRQRLMRSGAEETMEENGRSLRERFEGEKKTELKVERQPVSILMRLWGIATTIVGSGFAAIGLLSLAHPGLRSCLVDILTQFMKEIAIS